MISDRDCALLYVLIIIQLLRTPEVISYNKQIIDKFGHNLTNAQSERYARMASLLFGKINPSVNWIFQSVSEEFFSKHFAVLVSRTPFILSCQRPVLCSIFSQDLINIYFPIASNLCLSLSDFSYNNGELYVEICDNFTDWLNYHIFNVEGRFICSSMPVTELDFYKYCNDLNQ